MQVLTEKNTVLSQELKECKAQLEAALAAAGEPKETPSGKIHFEGLISCEVRRGYESVKLYCRWRRTRSGQATATTPAKGRREGAYKGAAREK